MGVVFRAHQISLNRPVALKMIRDGELAGEAALQRFRTEAENTAHLDHPNIVPIYEVGEHEGHLFFSMKLIEGGSLAEHPCFSPTRGGGRPGRGGRAGGPPRSPARPAAPGHQAGQHPDRRAGNAVHHRLRPGPAARRRGQANAARALVGTLEYMAPDEAAGRGKELTTATDVYGVGTLLYALLTGRPPTAART